MKAEPCRSFAILVIFCIIHGALSALTTKPKNAIISKGDDVNMECSTDLTGTNPIKWKYDISDITSKPCESLFPARFLVSRSTTTDCFIVGLGNSSIGNQGPYVCSDGSGKAAEAVVLLMDPKPECRVQSAPIRGQNVTLSCSMTYRRYSDEARLNPGATVTASVSWESAAGTSPSSSSTAITGGIEDRQTVGEVLQANVITLASGTVIPSYKCTSRFQFAERQTISSTFAANNLSWTFSCAPIRTWYCPESVTIGPTYENYEAGNVLTCEPDGYPVPSFQWTDSDGVVVSTSNTTTLGEGPFNLTCTATGNFTTPCSASATVSGNAAGTTTGDTGLSSTTLALLIALPILLLLLTLAVVIAAVLLSQRRKGSKDERTNERTDDGKPRKSAAFFQAVGAPPPAAMARRDQHGHVWMMGTANRPAPIDNRVNGRHSTPDAYVPRYVSQTMAASRGGSLTSTPGFHHPTFVFQSSATNLHPKSRPY